jgi:hypothetical protein
MNTVMMPAGLPVSLPSFMPASHARLSDTKSQDNYAFVDGGDQIDFDLLAEYLLDEQGVDTGSSAFDFRYIDFLIHFLFHLAFEPN